MWDTKKESTESQRLPSNSKKVAHNNYYYYYYYYYIIIEIRTVVVPSGCTKMLNETLINIFTF